LDPSIHLNFFVISSSSSFSSIVTRNKGYLIQTQGDKDLHDWLYAINPLLAGQIRSTAARNRAKVTVAAPTPAQPEQKVKRSFFPPEEGFQLPASPSRERTGGKRKRAGSLLSSPQIGNGRGKGACAISAKKSRFLAPRSLSLSFIRNMTLIRIAFFCALWVKDLPARGCGALTRERDGWRKEAP